MRGGGIFYLVAPDILLPPPRPLTRGDDSGVSEIKHTTTNKSRRTQPPVIPANGFSHVNSAGRRWVGIGGDEKRRRARGNRTWKGQDKSLAGISALSMIVLL